MIEFKKIGIHEINILLNFLFENQNYPTKVINDFGEIIDTNEYGTCFLKTKNHLFTVLWINQSNGKIQSIGFGGPILELTLKELLISYPFHSEVFNYYDNEYCYSFYDKENYDHILRLHNPEKLFENHEITRDIAIHGIDIILVHH